LLVTADPGAGAEPPRRAARGRRAAALTALALGVAGFVISAVGVAAQILPREFTAGQQQQIKSWEIASRWQELTAGRIFPATVSYQLSAQVLEDTTPLNLNAMRVGIAPQSGCTTNVTTTAAAAAVLRQNGCKAILRATYTDSTRSYVMTVGVAVLPSGAAAAKASQSLTQPHLTSAGDANTEALAAGILAVRYRGSDASRYNYNRQLSGSIPDGPYLIMYSAGYADSRPRVPLTEDQYSDQEMNSLASGVAWSVADTLGAAPASPHCPGTPGC
jgi:hypothetical protein